MRLLVTLVALVGCTFVSAKAADLKPLPTPFKKAPLVQSADCRWCGLYFGGTLGYGGADFIANFDDSNPLADVQHLSAKHSANSMIGGANLGYHYQFGGMFVLGAETDISMTGIKNNDNGMETRLPWLGTTRVKAGIVAFPDVLVYATGGAAYGHVKVSVGDAVFKTPTVGWTVGGGVEYKLMPNIGIGAEYLHVDLDGPSMTVGTQTLGTRVPVDIVRGKVGYYF